MSEVILCNQPMTADYLQNSCGINKSHLLGANCAAPNTLSAFTPYILGENLSSFDRQLLSQFSTPRVASELTNLSLSFGEDNTLALAEITRKLQEFNVGLIGASTSVYANRIGGFAGAVKEYQEALISYRAAVSSNSASKAVARQKAFVAFQKLQVLFRHELDVINTGVSARRGTPLSSATRATNIARSSRNVAKLHVASQVEANNLVKFSQHAKFLGNGLAVIDFGSRIGNIHNSYKEGGNWERELFVESTSFALSAGSGILTVNAGTAALGLLMVATPIGWVGLIVGGIVIAGTAAAVSMSVNHAVKDSGGSWYDTMMKALSVK